MCNFGLIVVPGDTPVEDGVPYFYLNGDENFKVIGEEISKKDQEIMYQIFMEMKEESDD